MVEHVKAGARDGPSEAVVKQVNIFVLSAKEGRCQTGYKLIIHLTCQIQILQLLEYEFHIMIFVDTLQFHISDFDTSKWPILNEAP